MYRFFGVPRIILDMTVILVIFAVFPWIPPYTTFSGINVKPPMKLSGPLAPNYKLENAERIFEGQVKGPESIASRKQNEIFLSLHGGKILKVFGERFQKSKIVTSIGPGCGGFWEEEVCGRPLGLRFAPDGKLLVADAYLGLFSVDVDSGEKIRLIDPSLPINGVKPLILDDLDITSEGDVYISDASTVVDLANSGTEILSDPSGRLLKYNLHSKQTEEVLNKLHFANGVQLSPNQEFLLVSETFKSQIIRYWLKGPKTGTKEVFIDGLPGCPDNIRPRPEGGYYISLVTIHQTEKHGTVSFIQKTGVLKKILARMFTLTKLMFEALTRIYPNEYTAKMAYNILNLGPLAELFSGTQSIIVEIDESGKIIDSLQGSSGKIMYISETHKTGNHMFFGSPYNDYLGYMYIDPVSEDDQFLVMEPMKFTISKDGIEEKQEL